jgi:hypothetical protein
MLVSCRWYGHLLRLDVNGCVLPIQIYDLYVRSVVQQFISLVSSNNNCKQANLYAQQNL